MKKFDLPWVCMGDFNEITSLEEKLGGALRSDRQMQMFRDCLDFCGFKDIGFTGLPFTWCNNRFDGPLVWVRLDRALASAEWMLKFPSVRLHHLAGFSSDHKPIWLCSDDVHRRFYRPQKPFRFEEMWLKDEGCEGVVNAAWDVSVEADPMLKVLHKVNNCQSQLKSWNKNVFGNIRGTLVQKRKLLAKAEIGAVAGQNCGRVKDLKEEINKLLDLEECMWSQRAKTDWLRYGDRNSKYFHCRASDRNKRNFISGLEDDRGLWVDDEERIGELLNDFYSSLFSSSNPTEFDAALVGVEPRVTREMNDSLTRPFVATEVETALAQMKANTSPGPDGFPPLFYKQYWPKIGAEVSDAVIGVLNTGILPHELNHTFLTLIPKIKSPRRVSDFRPISLTNVLYKLIAKVLANRLKKFLPELISETQSAFVPGRLITDNILIAHETLHYMKSKRSGKVGLMALKLDMSKAYDRVEWSFLEKIMATLGFSQRWISLISMCIRSVTYSILLNGQPHGLISPHRGLRQGDPLSPYLFLLITEGLHGLLKSAEMSGSLRGVSLCPAGPRISHLLFADDSLIFCRASLSDCQTIQSILQIYENASGQNINRGKTNLFFSSNTPAQTQEDIKNLLAVPVIQRFEQYLGLPSFVGRAKKRSFSLIKERIWKKLKGWKEKLLSQAGREILIKAVVQAIPTYTMSCFKLPKGLINEIEGLIRKFWWGYRGEQKRIHWVSWEKLCLPKSDGGMGFRELSCFNDSLLAKQVWRLKNNESSLFYSVFKAKFFPFCSITEATCSSKGSFAWKSILQASRVVELGSVWQVGDGKSIKIRGEKWLPPSHGSCIVSPLSLLSPDSMVSALIDVDSHSWNSDLIQREFLSHEAKIILGIPLSIHNPQDRQVWFPSNKGAYTTRSAYRLLSSSNRGSLPNCSDPSKRKHMWKGIWSLQVPQKIKHMLWKAANNAIPTLFNLWKRNVVKTVVCPSCDSECEDTIHALWSCPVLRPVWETGDLTRKFLKYKFSSFADLLDLSFRFKEETDMNLLAVLFWSIWEKRNTDRERGCVSSLHDIRSRAVHFLQEFASAQLATRHLHVSGPAQRVRWTPPISPHYKVNYDGALFNDLGAVGLGVIIRDSDGCVIGALAERISLPSSVATVEALACRRAVQFALELSVFDAIFEGDAEIVTKALHEGVSNHPDFGLVINDSLRLATAFRFCHFSHVKRMGNTVAHLLARSSKSGNELQVWMESVPEDIAPFVFNDAL